MALLLAKARRFVRRFHREHADVVQDLSLTDNDIAVLHVYTLECEIYRRVCVPGGDKVSIICTYPYC